MNAILYYTLYRIVQNAIKNPRGDSSSGGGGPVLPVKVNITRFVQIALTFLFFHSFPLYPQPLVPWNRSSASGADEHPRLVPAPARAHECFAGAGIDAKYPHADLTTGCTARILSIRKVRGAPEVVQYA